MATLRYVLWDNDGVLVDTEEGYFHATQRALAERLSRAGQAIVVQPAKVDALLEVHRHRAQRLKWAAPIVMRINVFRAHDLRLALHLIHCFHSLPSY